MSAVKELITSILCQYWKGVPTNVIAREHQLTKREVLDVINQYGRSTC